MTKYRALFLEEGIENLAEMSRSLLELEKDPASRPSIETVFRMVHSMKSMAASLEYESISLLAHRLEDRMESVRTAGRIGSADDLPLLFRGLEVLEAMLASVAETGDAPDGDAALLAALESPSEADDTEKKALI